MEQKDKYVDQFTKCAQWLENNPHLRTITQWAQQHTKLVVGLGLILACVLYVWYMRERKFLAFQNSKLQQMAKQIEFVAQEIKSTEKEYRDLRQQVEQSVHFLEQHDKTFREQLDILMQSGSMGKLPLTRMELNGHQVSLPKSGTFWIRENYVKISKLHFGEEAWGNTLVAARDVRCSYSINRGPMQQIAGIDNSLMIPLPTNSEETKFFLLLSKIIFNTSAGNEYTGYAAFTVSIDIWPPEVDARLSSASVYVIVRDRGGEALDDGLYIAIQTESAQKKWQGTLAQPGTFDWKKLEKEHHIQLAISELGVWKKLAVEVKDAAGNATVCYLRNLPCPRLNHKSGTVLSQPVILNVIPTADIPMETARVYLEKLENAEFRFWRETATGAISLSEGRYRAKAFFLLDGEHGPYGDQIEFRVDTTIPQGELILSQQANILFWEIKPNEPNVKVWTSVKWQEKFYALNVIGSTGKCEVPQEAKQITVQVKLEDEAGNENNLVKIWDCN